jgi:hypothetical protein
MGFGERAERCRMPSPGPITLHEGDAERVTAKDAISFRALNGIGPVSCSVVFWSRW